MEDAKSKTRTFSQVANAGMGASGPITEMTDDYYNKTTAVNFGGVVSQNLDFSALHADRQTDMILNSSTVPEKPESKPQRSTAAVLSEQLVNKV